MDPAAVQALASGSTRSEFGESIRRGLLVGAVVLFVVLPPAGRPLPWVAAASGQSSNQARTSAARHATRFADFGVHTPSPDARFIADWVADSGDNGGVDFIIVDKQRAKVYVFDARAHLRAAAPVLIGAALGDTLAPGTGSLPWADVRQKDRITPAGRFVAERGHDETGQDVIWVDYDAAIAMHRVFTAVPQEHRLERLATKSVTDKRISYGCINVGATFYDAYIRPVFARHPAVVYVLPDTLPVRQVFRAADLASRHALGARGSSAAMRE
ncbi:MAG: hypothetical protein KGJ25_08605 [Betaproteobacteria bacterium]|nr:hypothetical protein [Betaproteobacteria bacterium]